MSRKISYRIADFLLRKKVIEEDDIDIYQYGYEVLLNSLAQMVLLLLLGCVIKSVILTCIFIFVFVTLRQYTGGFHANTKLGCTGVTVGCYFIVMYLMRIGMSQVPLSILAVLSFVICETVIWLHAPVEHVNKPLSTGQNKMYREKALLIATVFLIITLPLYYFYPAGAYVILFTMLTVAVLMIIKRGRGRKMKLFEQALDMAGEKAARKAVNSASWAFTYQEKEPKMLKDKLLKKK